MSYFNSCSTCWPFQLLLLSLLINLSINPINSDPNEQDIEQLSVAADGKSHFVKKVKANQPTQHPAAMGVIFKNPRPYPVRYYWWSGTNSVYQGPIPPKSVTATNSYVGHVFYFTSTDRQTRQETEFFRVHIVANVNQYILPPEPGQENDPHFVALMEEKSFVDSYFQRTGVPWLAFYPRDPPIHHMWPATFIGEKHIVTSKQTHWRCVPHSLSDAEVTQPTEADIQRCHAANNEELHIELEVISQKPRAFVIKNTLSEAECDLIIKLAASKVKRSRAGQDGGLETTTRTSKNAWLGRRAHYVLDTIYRRAADIMNISESLFQPRRKGNVVEDMQVLLYGVGEQYTPHHDFGANGRPEQRYVTLLFYLSDQLDEESGGETNFPKADGGKGVAVHPGKGSSIMFYSILPDGNADDKSLHAALPVLKGIKWLANFWVWDPQRS